MKTKFLLFLFTSFLFVSTSWGQEDFVKNFLGLNKKEETFLSQIKIKTDKALSHKLNGFAYKNQKEITLASRLELKENVMIKEATIVHELIHQAYYEQKPLEEDWVLEGVALLGEFLYLKKKYGKKAALQSFMPIVQKALEEEQLDLLSFEVNALDYGKSFLFFLFIYESFFQDDFSHTHLHTLSIGLKGVVDATQMGMSFRLTPKNWKNPKFLTSVFYWSLLNRQNMIATTANDLFTQILSAVILDHPKASIKSGKFTLRPYSFIKVDAKTCERWSFEGMENISPYATYQKEKALLENGSWQRTQDSILLFINPHAQEKSIELHCLD